MTSLHNKTRLSWSGGKDSAWALQVLRVNLLRE
jgi:diphthamide synthase (EF-2-diphthine--ammonia ligase)